jgi:hypothetical protein
MKSGVGVVVVLQAEVKVEINVRKYFPAPTQLIARIADCRFTERRKEDLLSLMANTSSFS